MVHLRITLSPFCPGLLLSHGTPPPVTHTKCSVLMGCQPQSTTRWWLLVTLSMATVDGWLMCVAVDTFSKPVAGRQSSQIMSLFAGAINHCPNERTNRNYDCSNTRAQSPPEYSHHQHRPWTRKANTERARMYST